MYDNTALYGNENEITHYAGSIPFLRGVVVCVSLYLGSGILSNGNECLGGASAPTSLPSTAAVSFLIIREAHGATATQEGILFRLLGGRQSI